MPIGQVSVGGSRVTRELEIGDHVKVVLPGEAPWAEVLEIRGEGFLGRIDNHPASDLHDYRFGEKVWFVVDEHECWSPAGRMSDSRKVVSLKW